MPYATHQDLLTRFGPEELLQLTDTANAGTIQVAVVQRHLDDADALIDGYLAQRYALPVSPVPALLVRLACDLARHSLHGQAAPEHVRAAHKDALALLRDLSKGDAAIAGALPAGAGAAPAAAPGSVRVAAPDRVFGQGAIADYLG